MKTYGWVEIQAHAFLTSAVGEYKWSASRPGRFTLNKEMRIINFPNTDINDNFKEWILACIVYVLNITFIIQSVKLF
jgi:hypothetical protein